MKKYILFLLLSLIYPNSCTKNAPQDDQANLTGLLVSLEKEGWEACKRHDTIAFANLCTKNQFEIWGDGQILTVRDIISQIPDTEILEYTMDDIKVFFPSKKTAIVRYKILSKVSYKGNLIPSHWMIASSVWVKNKSDWKFALYQETPLPE